MPPKKTSKTTKGRRPSTSTKAASVSAAARVLPPSPPSPTIVPAVLSGDLSLFLGAAPLESSASDDSDVVSQDTPASESESLEDSDLAEFPAKEAVVLTAALLDRLRRFPTPLLTDNAHRRRHKRFSSGRCPDLSTLQPLNIAPTFRHYFQDIGWLWLFNIPAQDVYCDSAVEFFTTFKFKDSAAFDEPCVSFRLFDTLYDLTLTEWCLRLGVITPDHALSHSFREELCGFPPEFDVPGAWAELARPSAGPFVASRSEAADLLEPVLRICHLFLVHCLLGRTTTFNRIGVVDLFLLWCMHTRRRVNLGYWIAHSLRHVSAHPDRHLTLCHFLGAFIHGHISLTIPVPLPSLVVCPSPTVFDISTLTAARVISTDPAGHYQFTQPGHRFPSSSTAAGTSSSTDFADELRQVKEEVGLLRTAVTALQSDFSAALATTTETILAELRQKRRR